MIAAPPDYRHPENPAKRLAFSTTGTYNEQMPGPRPFNRRQALENARFVEALRRTGNPRLAADLLGVHRSTYLKRRAKCAAFAQAWDAAIAFAHAAFHEANGAELPPPVVRPERSRGACPERSRGACPERSRGAPLRTQGGELVVGRTRNGRLQLRRAPKGWMTKAGEQAFFAALSATANVRLSAAATGFTHSAFYQKKAKKKPFAREMRLAHKMGYDRVELALHAAGLPESHADDAWRHNDPPPVPQMTPSQALQLLHLHEKSVRQSWDRPHRRKRRGESWDTYTERLRAMWVHEKAVEAEDWAVRRAAQWEETGDWRLPEELEEEIRPGTGRGTVRDSIRDGGGVPALPALDQVAGWSKADPKKTPHNPDLALFGGWRLKDGKKRERKRD